MALRRAAAYSKRKVRPFTRVSRVKSKTYIKVVPHNKVAKYAMGNQQASNSGKHGFSVKLISEEKVQIRDNALESARMYVSKVLDTEMPGEYFFAVKVYPHHILRENKTAAGAGADRLSSGMKHSYGVVIGRAAIVNPQKEIFFITCTTEKGARIVRETLAKIKSKLPCNTKIVFEKTK